jgi:hypothetical protein
VFESIIVRHLRPTDAEQPLDLGFLVETMLFYGRVEVIANEAMIKQLIRGCGVAEAVELLERQHLQLVYRSNFAGIQTQNAGTARERYAPVVFELHRKPGKKYSLADFVPPYFRDVVQGSRRAKALSQRFLQLAHDNEVDKEIATRDLDDFKDDAFLTAAALDLVRTLAPEYQPPANPFLALDDDGTGRLRLRSNLNFAEADRAYQIRVPPSHSSFTPSSILSHVLNAREMLEDAAARSAELAVDPAHGAVVTRRLESILGTRRQSQQKQSLFSDFVFQDSRAIAEAINSRERSFRDVLDLLDEARKFRDWIREKPEDSDLLRDYFREATASTWADKLPAKAARWAFFTGVGVGIDALGAGGVGTAVGAGLGLADAMFLDPLLRGWKPNQFVEGPLRRFVEGGPTRGRHASTVPQN